MQNRLAVTTSTPASPAASLRPTGHRGQGTQPAPALRDSKLFTCRIFIFLVFSWPLLTTSSSNNKHRRQGGARASCPNGSLTPAAPSLGRASRVLPPSALEAAGCSAGWLPRCGWSPGAAGSSRTQLLAEPGLQVCRDAHAQPSSNPNQLQTTPLSFLTLTFILPRGKKKK